MRNMNLHDIAFWICAFFLLGVFLTSISSQILIMVFLTALISLFLLFFKNYYFGWLVLFAAIGIFYYQAFDYFQKQALIPFEENVPFQGIVEKSASLIDRQELTLALENPYSGKVQVIARPYPVFRYGDLVKILGIIKKPAEQSADYLVKNGILGTITFPEIILEESGHGNFIKTGLLNFKNKILDIFQSVLPAEKAAFLSGLTLGERANFSAELKKEMSLSGTTHLVALSGYNISVIAWAVASILRLYLTRSLSFYFSVLIIVLFVLMTGAEASVVRAAIMGIIAILAKETERIFSVRNAIVIAAFLMVLANPRVLAFDLGFQLSFAALLGIIYIKPMLENFTRFNGAGILSWKENSLTTFSAQLAVIPLLLGNFGMFSITSFIANILILEAVPITMGLGFVIALLGFFSGFLAQIFALAANLFLSYELWVIGIFSKLSFPIIAASFGF